MATYPDIEASTIVTSLTEIELEQSESGIVRGQDLNAITNLYEIVIKHIAIDETDTQTLKTFFVDNRDTIITTRTVRDRETYDCLLDQEPIVEDHAKDFKNVTWNLVGTRN